MLTSAAELFQRQGVEATALSDIVERSGAPRGSLYHYFPDGKAQLAAEATALAGRRLGAMMSAVVAENGPVEALRLIVGFFRQVLVDSGFRAGCPAGAGALEGGSAPGARLAAGESFNSWESTIANALWQRGMAVEEAESFATLAIAAVEGAVVLGKAQGHTRALDRVEGVLLDQLRRALPDGPV